MFKKLITILRNRISYKNGNQVILYQEDGKIKHNPFYIKGLKLNFNGKNSIVKIKYPVTFNKCNILLNDDCSVNIGTSKHLHFTLNGHHESNLIVADGVQIGDAIIHMENERGTSLKIDKNAILAYNIQIYTTDTHPIFDLSNNKMINNTKSTVHIGERTWVCANSILLKGADIADDSIVGNASVVTKKFTDTNVILGGNPAQIVKKGIFWRGGVIS